jgi:3-dehydroquinate dehydratase II
MRCYNLTPGSMATLLIFSTATLKDCVKGAGLPYVEVHISNIAKRGIHCVLSDVAEGFITGFGMHSYILGLDAMLEILRARRQEPRS